MVELFEGQLAGQNRQSSKGNQLKWQKDDIWYKADYAGYEGLAECVISRLLEKSSLNTKYHVRYEPVEIMYKEQIFQGCQSRNFLQGDWQIITLERFGQYICNVLTMGRDCCPTRQWIIR